MDSRCFSNKLLSVLNLLCNSTQNFSIVTRDACYGCFFRVGVLPPGSSLLNQLSQCANIYLANTSYAGCAAQLAVSVLIVYANCGPRRIIYAHAINILWTAGSINSPKQPYLCLCVLSNAISISAASEQLLSRNFMSQTMAYISGV